MDIESMGARDLIHVWDTYQSRRGWHDVIRRGGDREVARRALSRLDEVTAVEALEANRRLVDLLIDRRWAAIEDAREAEASWSQIGAALRMSKQAAQDWYRRKVNDQEKYAPDFHDVDRARTALDSTDAT